MKKYLLGAAALIAVAGGAVVAQQITAPLEPFLSMSAADLVPLVPKGVVSQNNMYVPLSRLAGFVLGNQYGLPPVLTSCGTSPVIAGNDLVGTVTMGTGSPTGCVITFAVARTTAPSCMVVWEGTPLAAQHYTTSATAITLVQTATSSNKVDYFCPLASGG